MTRLSGQGMPAEAHRMMKLISLIVLLHFVFFGRAQYQQVFAFGQNQVNS
jgi:hypothetical protein